jgi:molybdopterin converting factor small subunit
MFKCKIRIYGLTNEISELREVELELRDGAGMKDVVAGLRRKIPALEGPVIHKGEDRLMEFFKFNVNGKFYFDSMDFELKEGDRIGLLMPVTGG